MADHGETDRYGTGRNGTGERANTDGVGGKTKKIKVSKGRKSFGGNVTVQVECSHAYRRVYSQPRARRFMMDREKAVRA